MRLKSLEIKGFKSFADKTVIHFNENMTGIVGPNGCGKSNTVDAIRWVLGEQKSKALRLEKMDNIIFNGTKKRKASGRAEVSLTFENTKNLLPTEFTTVTVSRVIFRSGDSEYRLNGVKCRLKDITNLFMDTGVSSDSYAIIELKMIDEILNDKENSRRKLFEQASGISKYKVRKRQTLLKLKATDADLDRVEDLLFEIEKNLKTLERQAKRTKKYYELKEQYKELSVELAKYKLAKHKTSFDSLIQKETAEKDKKLQIETSLSSAEAKLEKKKVAVIEQEKALSLSQRTVNEHLAKLTNLENEKNLLNQNVRFLREKRENLQQLIQGSKNQIVQLDKEVEYLKWDKKGEEEQLGKQEAGLKQLRETVDIEKGSHAEKRDALTTLQSQLKEMEREMYSLEKNVAIRTTQRDNISSEINQNKMRFQSHQSDLEEQKEFYEKANKELGEAETKLQALLNEEEAVRAELESLEGSIEESRNVLSDANRTLDSQRNEYKLTKSLVDSLEGFPDSIKYLKKNQAEWTKDAPLLLDILNCEEAYKGAIENYLKAYLNNYVVGNVEQAKIAIQLLDAKQKGKAQFFVLSDLESSKAVKQEEFPAAIIASSIMKVDAKYKALVNLLLTNVYLVDDGFEAPVDWLQNGAVFLSKSGKYIRQQSSLSGGSVGAFEGKRIGKRQQLEQLEKSIAKLEAEVKVLQAGLLEKRSSQKGLQETRNKKSQWIKHQQAEVNKWNNKAMAVKLKIDTSTSFLAESEVKETDLNVKIDELGVEIETVQLQLDAKRSESALLQEKIDASNKAYQAASSGLNEASQKYNEQHIEFHKQQNRIHSLIQSLEFKQQQLEEQNEQLKLSEQTLEETKVELLKIESNLKHSDTDLVSLYDLKKKLEGDLQETENLYYAVRGEVEQDEKGMRQLQRNKEQTDALIQEFKDQINLLKMQLLSLKERLSIEFKVDIDEIIDQDPKGEIPLSELEPQVLKIKDRIERFGEINPMAVEAYDEMKERYDFIITQREDLFSAKTSLLDTIKEIEEKATEKFMVAFDSVRTHFKRVFRSLFTEEDQCDLILVDPSDPLESSIDITAKPKGKRPQSINQLSGGEKSLTALALVFSLYLLKPAPFCILDEVDAPLDDANVGKFTGIIREFSENSQFIIVTHNKNTMASVDVIYGVTMHEAGVSSVLPVDFRELGEI